MISNIINIQLMQERNRWDFSSYHPNYEHALKTISSTKWKVVRLGELAEFFKYGASIPADYVEEGTIFLRAQNIREYGLDLSDKCLIDTSIYSLERYTVETGDILITRSGINVGEAAIVTKEFAGSVHGSYSIRLRLSPSDVSPEFIAFSINSPLVRAQIMALKSRSAQPNINIAELSSLRIVIPSVDYQNKITQIMQETYAARKDKILQAQNLIDNIDQFILHSLNIFPEKVEEKKRFIAPISTLATNRLDVGFSMGFHKFDPYLEHIAPISEVAIFPKETRDPSKDPETPFNYIDISSINVTTGTIQYSEEVLGKDAPSRARQVVHTGDIIVSTVRPTRGATAIIPLAMDNYVCSTGFSILHPNDKTSSAYLHLALRLNTTLEQFGRRSAGSSYPAILEKDIKETLIPLPSKELQDKIAEEVSNRLIQIKRLQDEADQLVEFAKKRAEKLILGEAIE